MRTCILIINGWTTIVLMSAVLLFPTQCAAWQDDPFDPFATDGTEFQDSSDDPATQATELPPIEDTLSDGVKLVVKSMRDANPTSPHELARAINVMLNVRQYDEAKIYLQKLIDTSLNDMQTFDLMNQVGPDFFLVLRDQGELQPEGSDYALKSFQAARRAAVSPQRISKLVSLLSDDDRFIRAEAVRNLRQIGAPGCSGDVESVCD